METKSKNARGGARQGSGRPSTDRTIMLSVRISQKAYEKISTVKKKSECIDELIKQHL